MTKIILDRPSRRSWWIMRNAPDGHYGKRRINSSWKLRRERVHSRCGHNVVRSMLWTRTIVLFSQRPTVRKYCVWVNIHTTYIRTTCGAIYSRVANEYTTLQPELHLHTPIMYVLYTPNFIDLACLASFPIDPFWRQFARQCARCAF